MYHVAVAGTVSHVTLAMLSLIKDKPNVFNVKITYLQMRITQNAYHLHTNTLRINSLQRIVAAALSSLGFVYKAFSLEYFCTTRIHQ